MRPSEQIAVNGRIGIVAHQLARGDGQGRVNLEIARYCAAQGSDVLAVSEKVDDQLAPGISICRVGRRGPGNLAKNFWFIAGCQLAAARQLRGRVVVGNGAAHLGRQQISIANFVHGAWMRSPYYPYSGVWTPKALYQRLFTRVNAVLERIAYYRADRVVAVSDSVKEELLAIGVPAGKIEVIFNGVDIQEFKPDPASRQAMRANLGLDASTVCAVTVGDLRTPRKNIALAIQALRQVPGLFLLVAGDTAGSPLPAWARGQGVEDRVRFLGKRSDLPAVMSAADFFVFPSRYETFGLVVLEAMASGLPVITAATVGASSLLTGDCGRVIADPNDLQSLVESMQDLARDADRRRLQGAAARRVAEGHDWRVMAGRYFQLIQKSMSSA